MSNVIWSCNGRSVSCVLTAVWEGYLLLHNSGKQWKYLGTRMVGVLFHHSTTGTHCPHTLWPADVFREGCHTLVVLHQRLQSPQLDHGMQKKRSGKPGGVEMLAGMPWLGSATDRAVSSLILREHIWEHIWLLFPLLHMDLCSRHTKFQINYLWNPVLTGGGREGMVRNDGVF